MLKVKLNKQKIIFSKQSLLITQIKSIVFLQTFLNVKHSKFRYLSKCTKF